MMAVLSVELLCECRAVRSGLSGDRRRRPIVEACFKREWMHTTHGHRRRRTGTPALGPPVASGLPS